MGGGKAQVSHVKLRIRPVKHCGGEAKSKAKSIFSVWDNAASLGNW